MKKYPINDLKILGKIYPFSAPCNTQAEIDAIFYSYLE